MLPMPRGTRRKVAVPLKAILEASKKSYFMIIFFFSLFEVLAKRGRHVDYSLPD
jgi:hypothetical protein